MSTAPPTYTKKEFMSDQLIRWCPGCGDYSILSQFQTVATQLGLPRHQIAVISGIGCSSRFPYYMGTYGFHTIHGRAPAFATGLKCTRPDLSVWMVTGDGDALSIGGNHIAHVLRRNVDINIMLFNNRIYGLTKGQYSPTSEVGKKTKSSPMGSLDRPFNPISFALGSGATCVMRSVDVFAKHLRQTLLDALGHTGTSFMEIYQNCNIFNDGAFAEFTDREHRDDRVIYVEAGKPLVWGKTERKGLRLNGLALEMVTLDDETTEADCLVHDPTSLMLAHMLAQLDPQKGEPVPLGTIYQVERPTYDAAFNAQLGEAKLAKPDATLEDLIHAGDTWTVD